MTITGKITKALMAGGLILLCFVVLYGMNTAELQESINLKSMQNNVNYFKEFSLQQTDGSTFTQDDIKDYKLTVFNGWAPWCPACVGEMPDLEELYEEMESEGVLFVGVVPDYPKQVESNDKYDKEIAKEIKRLNITYPVLLADQKFYDEVVPTMHNAFPGTWILDSDGKILKYISGAKEKDEWKEIIEDALK